MAEIYVARDPSATAPSGRVAIKRILPQLSKDPRFVAMFCDEARICAALSHPNIVQVIDFGEDQGELFIAMEYVDGISCAKLLRAVAARGQKFPIGVALYIGDQVLRALEYAHSAIDEKGRALGLVHRDVSPGNIMISRVGEVKLTDFGIVRSDFVARRTYPGELKGKIGYMAPEQVVGSDVDRRTDLFALGIVLSEMLIARPLFPGPSEMEILTRIYEANVDVLERHGTHLPPTVMALLRRALARKREDRFETATQFLAELRAVASEHRVVLDERELLPWLMSLALLPSMSGLREATRQSLESTEVSVQPLADTGVAAEVGELLRHPLVPRHSRPPGARRGGVPRRSHKTSGTFTVCTPRGLVASMTIGRVLEQVATGRIVPGTALRTAEGTELRLEQLPAVTSLLSGSAYRFGTPEEREADWSQPLERWRLPAVLYRLCARQATGLLAVRAGSSEKRIYWVDGVPRFISSTLPQELLGARLVRAGVVSAAILQEALQTCSESSPRRLGEVLVMGRHLDPSELLRQIVLQLRDRFVELGGWREGRLMFFAGIQHEQSMPQCAGPELVTRMIRTHYDADEIRDLLVDVSDAPIAAAPARLIALERLGIDADEVRVIESAAGARGLSSLCDTLQDRHEIGSDTVHRALFIGLSSGGLVSPAW